MTKMVNSWNEWDPLKRVILGRPEGANMIAPEPAWQHDCPEGGFPLGTWGPFPQEMVDKANEQMDYFAAVIEKHGAVVDRVEIHPAMMDRRAISTPDWTQINQHTANNPRDEFLPVGNEIMEAPGCRRSRWYEYLNLRPIFERYFKEDADFLWTSAPRPRLTDDSYEKNFNYNFEHVWTEEEKRQRLYDWHFGLTEKEPLWDAADACRFGKDIFWCKSAVTNRSGMDWLQRYFGAKGIRIHPVTFDNDLHPWHIDIYLLPVRPGLLLYNPDMPPLGEFFELFRKNDWELIPAAPPAYEMRNPVRLFGEWAEVCWVSMNTFSLGPNTVCVEAHETPYMDQLDKLGVEVIPIPYECVTPFAGVLHCTTLDVHREGGCEDYFPKQVAGF